MKNGMARVYVGDIGVIPEKYVHHEEIDITKLDLDTLSFRDMCNLAVALGVDIRMLIGRDKCISHYGMVVLGSNILPEGMSLFESCIYCRNCWQFFRNKSVKDNVT